MTLAPEAKGRLLKSQTCFSGEILAVMTLSFPMVIEIGQFDCESAFYHQELVAALLCLSG